MLAGLMTSLIFADAAAGTMTAVLGGVGLGLFVDEVGKFLTQTNDYFFRPAAAVIYLLFAMLVLLATQVRTRRGATSDGNLADAAAVAAAGMASGLSAARRASALQSLDGHNDQAARAIRELLELVPARPHRPTVRRLIRRPEKMTKWLVKQRWFLASMVVLFVFSRVAIDAVFIAQAIPLVNGYHAEPGHNSGAVIAGAISRTIEALLAVTGAVRWYRDRNAAIGWLKAALFVNLFITQLFNFTDSQFGAIAELPFLLLVFALLAYHRRRLPARPHIAWAQSKRS